MKLRLLIRKLKVLLHIIQDYPINDIKIIPHNKHSTKVLITTSNNKCFLGIFSNEDYYLIDRQLSLSAYHAGYLTNMSLCKTRTLAKCFAISLETCTKSNTKWHIKLFYTIEYITRSTYFPDVKLSRIVNMMNCNEITHTAQLVESLV